MKITEHDMLVTLAAQALSLSDLTGHDVLESLRALGHGHIVEEARQHVRANRKSELLLVSKE